MVNEINQKLLDLYKQKYPVLSQVLLEKNKSLTHADKATNPLLIKVDSQYTNSDLKVMFFGQETNYWYGEKNKGEFIGQIEPLLDLYESFYLKGKCYSYGGQFWNGVSRFKQLLSNDLNVKVGLVWNNVIKIGKCGRGMPFKSIQDTQFEYFNVIQEEIKILSPDILVFFSGPNYDVQIAKSFGELQKFRIENFAERQICQLILTDTPLAFRTYHPNYLWRNDINAYLNSILERVKSDMPV